MRWRLSVFATCLSLFIIMLGAYVRLSDAGLGCPDWPGCYGHLGVPEASHDVQTANQAFPERQVESAKAWKEMLHRYFASSLGVLILVLAGLAWREKTKINPIFNYLLVPLVMFQGLLGMWTVTWQLKPLVVTGHLIMGMATLAFLYASMLVQTNAFQNIAVANLRALQKWVWVVLGILILQIFLGGWTSTNYAALACTALPHCLPGQWLPTELQYSEAFTLWRGLGINYEYGVLDSAARQTIHWTHRVWALVTLFAIIFFANQVLRATSAPTLRRLATGMKLIVCVQVLIGLLLVHLKLPLHAAVAHNGGAALVLSCLITLIFALQRAQLGVHQFTLNK